MGIQLIQFQTIYELSRDNPFPESVEERLKKTFSVGNTNDSGTLTKEGMRIYFKFISNDAEIQNDCKDDSGK